MHGNLPTIISETSAFGKQGVDHCLVDVPFVVACSDASCVWNMRKNIIRNQMIIIYDHYR